MARTVYVCIVTVVSFIFNMGCRYGDTTLSFLWRVINLIVIFKITTQLFSSNFCDRCSQGRFTVVNVTDCAHVYMGLGAFKFFF